MTLGCGHPIFDDGRWPSIPRQLASVVYCPQCQEHQTVTVVEEMSAQRVR